MITLAQLQCGVVVLDESKDFPCPLFLRLYFRMAGVRYPAPVRGGQGAQLAAGQAIQGVQPAVGQGAQEIQPVVGQGAQGIQLTAEHAAQGPVQPAAGQGTQAIQPAVGHVAQEVQQAAGHEVKQAAGQAQQEELEVRFTLHLLLLLFFCTYVFSLWRMLYKCLVHASFVLYFSPCSFILWVA